MNNRQQTLRNTATAHRDNILRSLKHRLSVARANHNESLIRQLEAEANYLGTSLN